MHMDSISYTQARKQLAKTMDRVCDDRSPVMITRQNARPVVMMSLEDYDAIEETAYLLRSPANAARLAESMSRAAEGETAERELSE